MENKKIMIPIVLGVLLLCGIIFTVVYKKTSGPSPNDQPVVQTLAPKESKEVETRVTGESSGNLTDFDVNKAYEHAETAAQVMISVTDSIEDYEEKKESLGIISESDIIIEGDSSNSNGSNQETETTEEYILSEEQKVAATSEISEEMNEELANSVNEYTDKQAEDIFDQIREANGGELPWAD